MKVLVHDLAKLGLSEKEALVYLAALELGPSPVQVIARKAEVNRATTYVMIEALSQKGLVSSFEKGKKTMFTAEKPERLHRIVHRERELVTEKEETIKKILPDLEGLLAAAGDRPKVYFYEGEEGLEAMREKIFEHKVEHVDDMVAYDDLSHLINSEAQKKHGERLLKKKVSGRVIYTKESGPFPPATKHDGLWQYRRISKKLFEFHGELVVYGSLIGMTAMKGKLVGVVIESKEMAMMVRTIFELAWLQAEKY